MKRSFALEEEIWWELDKKAIELTKKGMNKDANEVEAAMKHFKKPTHEQCQKFFNAGY